ncbi:MAG: GntP family permease [Lachnospiraceae bacterium]|nr:GntP family permease [Lachnospiraceae bacterium]
MVGIIGIIIALALFLVLVYKGWSSYWVAPICAIIVGIFNLMKPADIIGSYVGGVVDLISSLFFIVFFGAILGKVYNDSGAAAAIAKTLTNKLVIKSSGNKQVRLGVLVILVVSALCTMGGIDGYVLTFTLIPICFVMCEMLDIPRRFIGGMMVLNCAFMACPGAPQIDNIMARAAVMSEAYNENGAFIGDAAMSGFSVSSTSAAIPGIVSTAFIAICGYFVLCNFIIKAKAKGEHFEWGSVQKREEDDRKLPNFFVALLPLITVFVLYTLIPAITGVEIDIAIALGLGIVVALLTMARNLPFKRGEKGALGRSILKTLNIGSEGFAGAMFTLCMPSALAGVVTASAGFGVVVAFLAGINISPIALVLIAVCVLVAITSSPPAALMIAVPVVMNIMLGQGFLPSEVLDMSPAIMRVSAIAATTFETLPINGLIILTLKLIGCSHKEAYKPMFLQSVLFTLGGAIIATVLIVLFPALA